MQLNTELVNEIGVGTDTINAWVDEFKIPLPEKYQKNAVQVLRMIKDLKDKNCGYQTIQRQIQLDHPELKTPNSPQPQTNYSEFQALRNERDNSIDELSLHFGSLRNELMELGELAEKYAQANYNIGQMSMQMKQLEEQNHKLRSQMKLLPSPEQWEEMQERETTYKNLLQGMQQRITALEQQVRELNGSAEPKRSLPDLPPAEPQRRQLSLPFELE